MKALKIIEVDGQFVTDSREVSEMAEVRHDNLLSKIRGYIDILDSSKLSSRKFFLSSSYKNEQNKEQPCFLLTRKGCDMVANKMTGEKGVLFTAEYVTEFEKMEQTIKNPFLNQSKEIQAIFSLDQKQMKLESDIKEFRNDFTDYKENSPLFSIECEELQAAVRKKGINILGGKDAKAYKDKPLRTKLYSDIQREIKRQFGLNSYKALKRSQLDIALEIVDKYAAPLILIDEITLLNNQIVFEKSVV